MEKITIQFSKKAYEDYISLPLNYKEIVDDNLERMEKGIPIDIKPIRGEKDTFRIRIGKYSLLFVKEAGAIIIIKIKTRGEIYK